MIEDWNNGGMEDWGNGMMEDWKVGRKNEWKNGWMPPVGRQRRLEEWGIGNIRRNVNSNLAKEQKLWLILI